MGHAETNIIRIANFLPISLVDWEGKIVSSVFLYGCHYNCPYCYNKGLKSIEENKGNLLFWENIFERIKNKKHLLDGVVFSGGEPLINKNLVFAIDDIKSIGLETCIHTACPNPKLLEKLTEKVDYFIIDAKGPDYLHSTITGKKKSWDYLEKSIAILHEKGKNFSVHVIKHDGIQNKDIENLREYFDKKWNINVKVIENINYSMYSRISS